MKVGTDLLGNLSSGSRYYVELDERGIRLMDPDGRRVAQLPGTKASDGRHGVGDEDWSTQPEATPEGWKEACRILSILLHQQTAENEELRDRVAELNRRLEAAEGERDQANAIAENLYEFLRGRMREVSDRKKSRGGRGVS